MNILVLNYEFPPIGGGASPVSYDISRHLAMLGHKITVVTMQYQNLPEHENIEGMELYRVKCIRKEANVCHPWEQLSYIFSAIHFIQKNFNVKKFDMMHTHFIIPTGVVAWWLKKKYGIPYILTAHGSDVIGHNNKRFKLLYQILKKPWGAIVRNAQTVVSPSTHLVGLMKKSEEKGNYVVIPNGIETSLFHKAKKKKSILIMCRLQETKGIQTVLKAISHINMKDWNLTIAGDGPYKPILEKLVHELKIEDKVIFRGWIKNRSEEQFRLLSEAKIFVSGSQVENCPISVLEAACAGCLVLVSDIKAHQELLKEKGFYFKTDDAMSCAEGLRNLMETEMPFEISDTDLMKWDWQETVKKYEAVIENGRHQ